MAHPSNARLSRAAGYDAPIDLVSLVSHTLGNRDLEVQVLRMFVAQSKTALGRLDGLQDLADIKILVHTMKGSARAVGADTVAAVCETVERELEAGKTGRLVHLAKAVGEANAYIEDLLGNPVLSD